MRRRRRHTRPVAAILGLLAAVSSLALVHASGSARASAVSWNLPFPQTMSYRPLGSDPNIQCGQSDAVFDQQVKAEGLDGYEIYVVSGLRGTCARQKAEQMKRLHPEKMIILYEGPTAENPLQWPGGTWAGYYLMMNRTTALTTVSSSQTQIKVANPQNFSVGDTAVMWSPTPADPYANSEWVSVTAISGQLLTVRRNFFGTGLLSYASPPLIAAAATGSGYPLPMTNLSDMAPTNPASGMKASQWLVSNLQWDFGATTYGGVTPDAMELDAAASSAPAQNTNGSIKNLDCNGDGIIDYCERNVGTPQQVDSYGAGYDQFVRALKSALTVYDTDATRPPKMLLADGESGLRSVSSLNGAEFESYPSWDNYTYSSPALATLGVWENNAGAPGDHFSYTFTKDATPLYSQAGCGGATDAWCSNADYRYGMVSALLMGGASAYNNELTWNAPQRWDEEATINQATTGLAPGYLGQPLGPATRVLQYASPQLVGNGGFAVDLSGVTTKSALSGGVSVTRDTSTAAPGSVASLRADVSRLTGQPAPTDARVMTPLSSSVSPGEYSVDFWAKGQAPAPAPTALDLGVRIDGVDGAPANVVITPTWTHYYLEFNATSAAARADVRFTLGSAIGSYWIDAVSVHRGNAGVITRQFTNGIVVLNDSFSTQTNVALPGGPYHHINGVQDRTVNNGASVGSMLPSIGAKDGVILLRG
jgi:hypothetical protein